MTAETKKSVKGVVVIVAGVLIALAVNTMFSITSKIPKVA